MQLKHSPSLADFTLSLKLKILGSWDDRELTVSLLNFCSTVDILRSDSVLRINGVLRLNCNVICPSNRCWMNLFVGGVYTR